MGQTPRCREEAVYRLGPGADAVHAEGSHCSTLHILQHCTASRNESSIPAGCWQSQGVKHLVQTTWRTGVAVRTIGIGSGAKKRVSTFCIFHFYFREEIAENLTFHWDAERGMDTAATTSPSHETVSRYFHTPSTSTRDDDLNDSH
jgi:hypothetical protein